MFHGSIQDVLHEIEQPEAYRASFVEAATESMFVLGYSLIVVIAAVTLVVFIVKSFRTAADDFYHESERYDRNVGMITISIIVGMCSLFAAGIGKQVYEDAQEVEMQVDQQKTLYKVIEADVLKSFEAEDVIVRRIPAIPTFREGLTTQGVEVRALVNNGTEYIDFSMQYHEEHDMMTPIVPSDKALPDVKDGSPLAKLRSE